MRHAITWKHQQKSASIVLTLTWNSKGIAVKISDKFHSCCIRNGKFHLALLHEIRHTSNATRALIS